MSVGWHKKFIETVKTETGCTHEKAMQVLAAACENTQDAYKQGYNVGFEDGKQSLTDA